MADRLAGILVWAMAGYFLIGLGFAAGFALRWSGRLDPVARDGSPGFRVLIIPGAALLWPWLALRLRKAR